MTSTKEIDERRARVVAAARCNYSLYPNAGDNCISNNKRCKCLNAARAIREFDAAAGYELAKRVTVEGKVR